MALEDPNKVDAIGIEATTGKVILSVLDERDWDDVQNHLLALQAKINAYIDFVEEGQLMSVYPAAAGRDVVIDVITRHELPPAGAQLLADASVVCRDLNIQLRTRHLPHAT